MPSDARAVKGRRNLYLFVLFVAATIIAHLIDPLVFRYVRLENVYGEDWGRMLRVMGFLPLWLLAGIALMLEERTPLRRTFHSRGGLVIAGATLGGIVTEMGKLLVRRLRPLEFGEYVFRPFSERTFSTAGLGMPSSHAGVAFGAAAILSRIYPRARVVWWGLAWGCGFTRIAAGAHFFSDIAVAAILGWLVGELLWRARGPMLGQRSASERPSAPAAQTPAG